MASVIIGSRAIMNAGYLLRVNAPSIDTDVFTDSVSENQSLKKGGADSHVVPSWIMKHFKGQKYASISQMLAIKLSHLGWANHAWDKHKRDIIGLLNAGIAPDMALYHDLVQWWKKELGTKDFLSLSQTKDDFFDDAVEYTYDHDYLHDLVAYPNKPVYTKVLKDGHSVLTDKDKFFALPREEQVRMFREEIAVIAVERWCIPSNGKISWHKAHIMSLKKTITTLTKGWATEFLVLNLWEFIKPDYSYYENIINTLKETKHMTDTLAVALFTEVAKDFGTDPDEFVYNLCEGDVYGETKDKLSAYDYKHIEQDGGGEGGSEDCYGIFEFDGRIYRAHYSYYSYHGHEYGGILNTLREVKPVEKTVTVYE